MVPTDADEEHRGGPVDPDELDELYPVVRRAVEDALWNVLGTAVYALFLVALALVGVSLLAAAAGSGVSGIGLPLAVGGGLVVAVAGAGLYRIAVER